MFQPQRLWLCVLLQHPGQLQVRLPLGLLLRPVLQRLPRRERVLLLQQPLQLWLLQHGRRLPLRLPAGVLQSGTGVRQPTAGPQQQHGVTLPLSGEWRQPRFPVTVGKERSGDPHNQPVRPER